MQKIRIRYSKTGKAGYISNLDLMATMQRAFIRAGIKLKYSKGFNPHPYMSVALPLSVGSESICELIDVAIDSDALPGKESIKLPEGIEILDIYAPNRKFNEIAWIEILGKMYYTKQANASKLERLDEFYKRKSIIITKRTKRGYKDLDIAPFIKDLELSLDKDIQMTAKISAQNPTINADDIISALEDDDKPERINIKRIDIYDTNMVVFT